MRKITDLLSKAGGRTDLDLRSMLWKRGEVGAMLQKAMQHCLEMSLCKKKWICSSKA